MRISLYNVIYIVLLVNEEMKNGQILGKFNVIWVFGTGAGQYMLNC